MDSDSQVKVVLLGVLLGAVLPSLLAVFSGVLAPTLGKWLQTLIDRYLTRHVRDRT
jgi:hypothetical protein